MAEKHLDYNPFAYTANNPFHHGNPDGRDIIPFTTILNQFNKLNVNHKDPKKEWKLILTIVQLS